MRRPAVRPILASRRARLVLAAALGLALILVAARVSRFGVTARASTVAAGQWVYLSDLTWSEASTGWLGVANEQVPARDGSFHGGALSLGGVRFEKGIGTFPLSEITYELDGQYTEFAAQIGLDDEALSGDSAVRFLVFLDEALVFETGLIRPGDLQRRVEIPLAGARQMRLVVDSPPDRAKDGFADWADARLLKTIAALGDPQAAPNMVKAQERQKSLAAARQKDDAAVRARGLKLTSSLPEALTRSHASGERPTGLYDPPTRRLWLSDGSVALALGLAGDSFAAMSLLDLETRQPRILDAAGMLSVNGAEYLLNTATRPDGANAYTFSALDDPVLGAGTRLELRLVTRDKQWHPVLRFTLFAGGSLVYEMGLLDDPAAVQSTPVFHFFDESAAESLWVGERAEYLSDFSRLRYARVYDDGIVRRESVGGGKPIFIWSNRSQKGLLLALLEEASSPTHFRIQVEPGQVQARWGLSAGQATATVGTSLWSPRLYVEATSGVDLNRAFGNLNRVFDRLYPEAPMPGWIRFQWLSWYAYNMDIGEDVLQRQADYIAANLADLGTWNILIDAGWYVSEGRPESDWRHVDLDKFPGGLRQMVDSFHAQGMRVVLYLSVPYIDSREQSHDWLGMRAIIDQHPDWLQVLGGDEYRQSFAFDFRNPEVRAYWSAVMEDFFVKYAVDGIKVDGIGNAEGAIVSGDKLDSFGLVDDVNQQTMTIYEFFHREATHRRTDAYLETGWLSPTFARPYVHTFRYGDEAPVFSSPYPFPGLVQHVDYAIIQKQILGQRPNMGAIYDDASQSVVNRWWLEAGLALGTHVTIGFDLTSLTQEALSDYRSLLTLRSLYGDNYLWRPAAPDLRHATRWCYLPGRSQPGPEPDRRAGPSVRAWAAPATRGGSATGANGLRCGRRAVPAAYHSVHSDHASPEFPPVYRAHGAGGAVDKQFLRCTG